MNLYFKILYFNMHEVALSLGTNNGNRFFYMRKMVEAIYTILRPPITMSDLYETEPVEVTTEQQWYFNRIIKGYYSHSVNDLLSQCCTIEQKLGRSNKGMRAERTADIDILLFDNENVNTAVLTVPHPAILRRRFCIMGLFQIMPSALIVTVGKTVGECFNAMNDDIKNQRMKTVHSIGEEICNG
jgi:2-amino-4-hydroxy-6-hydroxymethyldihydropteridine diphosphokinase